MIVSNTTVFNLCATACRGLDVEPPAALIQEFADLDTAAKNMGSMAPTANLPGLILDAWLAGRDPLADKKVQQAAIAQSLRAANLQGSIDMAVDQRKGEALKRHADEWLNGVIAATDQAAADLAAAHAAFPGLDLADTTGAVQLPPEQLEVWGRARLARQRIHRAVDAWQHLASAARPGRQFGSERELMLILSDLNLEQYEAMRRPSIDAVIEHGYPIKLATFAEHEERMKKFDEEADAEWNAEREARSAGRTQRRGNQVAKGITFGSLMR